MKFTDFLKVNKVSFYKLCQLGGYDAASNTRATQDKATGERLMPMDEFKVYCKGLSTYLNKNITVDMFDYDVEKVKLK
jgi:hypothetical protein